MSYLYKTAVFKQNGHIIAIELVCIGLLMRMPAYTCSILGSNFLTNGSLKAQQF